VAIDEVLTPLGRQMFNTVTNRHLVKAVSTLSQVGAASSPSDVVLGVGINTSTAGANVYAQFVPGGGFAMAVACGGSYAFLDWLTTDNTGSVVKANLAAGDRIVGIAMEAGVGSTNKTVWVLPPDAASRLASQLGSTGPDGTARTLDQHIPVGATTVALAAVGNAINTTNKYEGKPVWNTTTHRPVWAAGATAAAVWIDGVGTTIHTPV
jgi:hypothetical protein